MSQTQVTSASNGKWSHTEMEFEDRTIKCVDCGDDFIWTAGEQVFFHDKGLKNEPKRCKPCKQAKNERLAAITAAQASGIRQRIEVCTVRATDDCAILPVAGATRLLSLLLPRRSRAGEREPLRSTTSEKWQVTRRSLFHLVACHFSFGTSCRRLRL
jgi:hypothetical protein